MKHLPASACFGAVAAAVAYSDGASPVTTLIVGGLVAAGTWAVAYAIGHRRH